MESQPCASSSANPYHYSFSLCAGSQTPSNQLHNKTSNTFTSQGNSVKNNRFSRGYEQYTVSNEFNCELCDRSFHTECQYKKHVSEHVTCGRDGCKFTGHPKVVENHVRMQHLSGLYEKISKLTDDASIAKWIAERKRRYPTRKNIEEKIILENVKKERGERIKEDTRPFGTGLYGKGRKSNGSFSGNNFKCNKKPEDTRKIIPKTKNIRRERKNRTRKPEVKKVFEIPPMEECNGDIPPFRGIGSLEGDDEEVEDPTPNNSSLNNITDDEEPILSCQLNKSESTPSAKEQSTDVLINRSLGLLMSAYGSEASDDDGPPQEVKNQRCPSPILCQSKEIPKNSVENGKRKSDIVYDNGPSKASKNKVMDCPKVVRRSKDKRVDRNKRSPLQHTGGYKYQRKPTLLERLLYKEIMHERNVILQCVRYVVKNKYFDSQDQTVSSNASKNQDVTKDENIVSI